MQSASVLRLPVASTTGLPRMRVSERWAIFVGSLALYLATAVDLVLIRHSIVANALSRVASAYFVLYSRDPHLAAIGFVRNPLPALLTLPLLPFKGVFPALTQAGFAANLVSALFMAGAVFQLHAILVDAGAGRRLRLVLTILFALQPMLVYSGANGSAEAILLFFLLFATRELGRWLADRDLLSLVWAGVALAMAYLSGPEALPAAAGAVMLVGLVSFRRAQTDRWSTAACDAVIVAGPLLVAGAAWVAATWLITGDPFHQLSSVYGNASQIQALQALGFGLAQDPSRAIGSAGRLLILAPGLPIVLGLTVLGMARLREPRLLATVGLLVPVLVVMFLAQASGLVRLSLEGLILAVPLVALSAALFATSGRGGVKPLAAGLAIAVMALAIPTGLSFGGLVTTAFSQSDPPATAAEVSRYLDARHLPAGSVLLDSFTGFPVVLASENPRQFVITNDRDFRLALTDPAGNDVQYLLVPAPDSSALTSLDALNRTYPALYKTGAGMATLVSEFAGTAGSPDWRLYRLNPS